MLKESYLSNMKNLPKDAIKIVVTRSAGHPLAPSKDLLWDYKKGRINWDQYVERFKKEMDNDRCKFYMIEIKLLAKEKDIWLICYEKDPEHCHRSLLIDMINKLEVEKKDIEKKEGL